jgi:hypothetical protein
MTSNDNGGTQLLDDAGAYQQVQAQAMRAALQTAAAEGFQSVMINAARVHLLERLRALDPADNPADVQAAVDLVAGAPAEAVQALLLQLFAQGRLAP